MNAITVKREKSEIRAPPRKRASGKDDDQASPVFLTKAFTMISSCPPEIGGWSAKGDSIIIRDTQQFAEKIIPTAYKHNNFSSFVRQLNFYGFRKCKSEPEAQASVWEFRHPQFLKAQPHLLSEMRRCQQFAAAEAAHAKELGDLQAEVQGLNHRIDELHCQIDSLTTMVTDMKVEGNHKSSQQQQQQEQSMRYDDCPISGRKRRMLSFSFEPAAMGAEDVDAGSAITTAHHHQQQQEIESPPVLMRLSSTESAAMLDEFAAEGAHLPSGPDLILDNFLDAFMEETVQLESENGAENDRHQGEGASLQAEAQEGSVGVESPSTVVDINGDGHMNMGMDISAVLEHLSPELKRRFVDKLAETMGAQLSQNISQQAEAAFSQAQLAPSVQEQAIQQRQVKQERDASSSSSPSAYHLPSGGKAPEIAIPLASAAIAALISNMQSLGTVQSQSPQQYNIKTAAH
mmetsp:Transcript_1038/g.2012  ORF Transcript_1038/g.2012 Transcript_1038/m.2012 type:complete len:460 (+) Transcript_1038:88-1467(+)|eukprot:CAMPEP_0181299488 /NCGR_PEP_ID=MMETSP1101-20121128/6376_1 /TAXON_ID=46948 /ORGANISM="Rhodomonas abbreviata, Strain Caron Lab Isolate" /LENGTH=459 /DNA_ID=CAMNT_0023404647 /DNA_START=52 /DNA_END=1431 /DNA_ORIENTATION=+